MHAFLKKSLALMLVLMVSVVFIGCGGSQEEPASAPASAPAEKAEKTEATYLMDDAALLSEDVQQDLEDQAKDIAKEYKVAPYMVTVADMGTVTDAAKFADTYYEDKKLAEDGVLLVYSVKEKAYAVKTHGNGTKVLSEEASKSLSESLATYFENEDWAKGFEKYLNGVNDACYKHKKDGGKEDKAAADKKAEADKKAAADKQAQTKANERKQAAVGAAQYQLRYDFYSRQGMIDFLMSSGYTYEEAVYGADNSGTNWADQAASRANALIQDNTYSMMELANEVMAYGFTYDEAMAGISVWNIDWYEEAAYSAQYYFDETELLEDEILDQLISDGFSYDEAEYGVSCIE